jgi:hypothetical protein
MKEHEGGAVIRPDKPDTARRHENIGQPTVVEEVFDAGEIGENIGRKFERGIDEIMEDVPANEFDEAVSEFVKKLQEYQASPKEGWQKGVVAEIEGAAEALDAPARKTFYKWVEDGLSDEKSWLFKEATAWTIKDDVIHSANALDERLDFFDLEGELKTYRPHPAIKRRVEAVRGAIKNLAEERISSEDTVIEAFLHDAVSNNLFDVKPGIFSKMFGGREMDASKLFDEAINKIHFSSQTRHGISLKEVIRGHAKDKGGWKVPSTKNAENILKGIRRIAKQIKQELSGDLTDITEGEIHLNGVDSLSESGKAHQEVVLDVLRPIASDGRFTKSITFSGPGSFDKSMDTAAGYYEPLTKEVHVLSSLEAGYQDHALTHELAHAMQPEQKLPLKEAIRWNISETVSIVASGYVSRYSAASSQMYITKAVESFGPEVVQSPLYKDVVEGLKHRDLEEEWADSVAFSILSPMTAIVYPEKVKIVERVFEQYGMSLEEIRKRLYKKQQQLALLEYSEAAE